MPRRAAFIFSNEEVDPMTQDEIYEKVSGTLVEALNVDQDEVTPQATLQGDLGAESIDFLDIVFRREREFGIKIPRGELFPESIFQGDPDMVQDGKLTSKGLAELKARMPYADLTRFEQNPDFEGLRDLFTVDLISRYIQAKLKPSPN
jgi:acyl carrier protein